MVVCFGFEEGFVECLICVFVVFELKLVGFIEIVVYLMFFVIMVDSLVVSDVVVLLILEIVVCSFDVFVVVFL